MSQEDIAAILKGLDEYVNETTASPEAAFNALVAAGLVKKNGQPEEPFRT